MGHADNEAKLLEAKALLVKASTLIGDVVAYYTREATIDAVVAKVCDGTEGRVFAASTSLNAALAAIRGKLVNDEGGPETAICQTCGEVSLAGVMLEGQCEECYERDYEPSPEDRDDLTANKAFDEARDLELDQ